MLLGLRDWYNNDMRLDTDVKSAPREVYNETMAWYSSFDSPEDFFEEYYEITNDKKDFLVPDQCYEAYREQIYDRGATQHAFRQAEEKWLRAHGIIGKQKKYVNDYGLRKNCWVGVRLIGTYSATHTDYGKYNHINVVKDNNNNNNNSNRYEQGAIL